MKVRRIFPTQRACAETRFPRPSLSESAAVLAWPRVGCTAFTAQWIPCSSRLTIDRRVPWDGRGSSRAGSAGYLFSPIDLIADEIPIVGNLDDVIVVGVGLCHRQAASFPPAIWAETSC